MDGRTLTTNEIDQILRTSSNLTQRQKVWEASKEVGKELKEGLESVRDLRNRTVQALDYHSYFSYQVSEYDMTVEEMMALMDKFSRELRPLYRELHTWPATGWRRSTVSRFPTAFPPTGCRTAGGRTGAPWPV